MTCPGDLSLVGMNDMPLMDMLSSGLTTVRSPCYDLGAAAAHLLLEALATGAVQSPRVVMAPELIVRGTTGAPRGGVRGTGLSGAGRPPSLGR